MAKKVKKEAKETFEQALARLEEIAESLESGDLPLEDALKRYEDGVRAYRYCAELLNRIERRIEVLTKDGKGEIAPGEAADLLDEGGGPPDL